MDAFGKIISSVSQAFDFNQATFSGCVDVMVVEQTDGSLKSTPFHLRLGKLKVLKSKDKVVKIHINGFETGLKMRLGEAGEGYLVRETNVSAKTYAQRELKNMIELEEASNQARAEIMEAKSHHHPNNLDQLIPARPVTADSSAASKIKDNGLLESKNASKIVFEGDVSYKKEASNGQKVSIKTLRPTSEQLKALNLRLGMNTISYTVSTSLQGSQTMAGHIYYWPSDANIIISDIDGTITKTDFLGHFLPMVGKDWSQPGITPLYTNIKRNGYHLLYLTARPIGQSAQTKNFLESVYQDGKMLPHGPLFMSPDRTVPSIRRELSARPEMFKMAVLKDIRSLFPADHNPFHAGFGNRETDAIAYRSVGIPLDKVFIVNPHGHIHHHDNKVAKSYAIINTMLKEIFPGVVCNRQLRFPEDEGEAVPLEINDKALMSANVLKIVS